MKTLALAIVMATLAASAALATDGPGTPTDGTSRSGAHASAPLAGDTGPGGPTDGTGRHQH